VGLTYIEVKVANPADPAKATQIKFLVDSGAVYSLVPRSTLKKLGIAPHSRRKFFLANGDDLDREIGSAIFEYQGRRGDSLVIFGEKGASPLLGATTLEGFGFVLDPFRRELRTLPMLLH
jgi:clan AA aspartic protease